MTGLDEILDDLFLGCALRAFVELSVEVQAFPDPEQTRILAYRYYEEALQVRASPKYAW